MATPSLRPSPVHPAPVLADPTPDPSAPLCAPPTSVPDGAPAATAAAASAPSQSPSPAPFLRLSDLERFAQCPLSYRLHCLDRLPAQAADDQAFTRVLRRALALTLREHLTAGCAGPLDPELAATAYRRAWTEGELHDHGTFGEGLFLLHRWVAR